MVEKGLVTILLYVGVFAAIGAGLPKGTINMSHAVVAGAVQPKIALFIVMPVTVGLMGAIVHTGPVQFTVPA